MHMDVMSNQGKDDTLEPAYFHNSLLNSKSSSDDDDKPIYEQDVNFYDYDGTLVYSYVSDDFINLSTMPSNPTHEGLTAQGWNWSLNDAKDFVSEHGKLNIGQTYITDNGETRIYINLGEGILSPTLGLGINGSVDIDWGDDTAHGTLTGSDATTLVTLQHTYAAAGDYVIKITPSTETEIHLTNGEAMGFRVIFKSDDGEYADNFLYAQTVQKIELGEGVTTIDYGALGWYVALSSITIPKNVTTINGSAFQTCTSLSFVIIPEDITAINSSTFEGCTSLSSVIIPVRVTTIDSYAFRRCSSLSSVIIPGVTTIGSSVFEECTSLSSVIISKRRITTIGSSAFKGCVSLSSIIIPSGRITTISSSIFKGCTSLSSVIIPESVIKIESSAFEGCALLQSIIIPRRVETIAGGLFNYCYGLRYIKFTSMVPPTVTSSTLFRDLSVDIIMYVPSRTSENYADMNNHPEQEYKLIEY